MTDEQRLSEIRSRVEEAIAPANDQRFGVYSCCPTHENCLAIREMARHQRRTAHDIAYLLSRLEAAEKVVKAARAVLDTGLEDEFLTPTAECDALIESLVAYDAQQEKP